MDNGLEGPIKVSMDYMYLHERTNKYKETKHNPPHLILVEHRHGRCWAYQVPNKGVHDKASWLPRRIVQDLDNNGLEDAKIQLKSDQVPSIVKLQTAVQEIRPGMVIPTNSPVAESQCNGRVENIIRRVQEKVRTLRHQLESNIRYKISDDAPIMSWLVRWAAELLSKYFPGGDGRIPYERIRQESCAVPIAPFGESVMHLPLTTVKRNKGEPVKKMGVYLGTNERTEESVIGIDRGVVKCRSINRLVKEDRWNKDIVLNMRGTTWEPVPGVDGDHVPVDIDEDGFAQHENHDRQPSEAIDDECTQEVQPRINHDKLFVSRKAVQKYGPIDGCPACKVITRYGNLIGRIGYNHSDTCRARIIGFMEKDPEYGGLVQKHDRQQEGDNVEMIITEQMEETRGHVKKAIHSIQQQMKMEHCDVSNQLDATMLKMLIGKIEMAEVYSPPRVTEVARKMGLRAGWSLDITICDKDGRNWDFNNVEMRNRAVRKALTDEPLLLIGSPMCTAFSTMNRINYARMSDEDVKQRIEYGRKHIQFCAKLYAMQWRAGRYLLHEHPEGASSWQEECIANMLCKEGVMRVNGDQCPYGLQTKDGAKVGLARKATGFMTNSICIAQKLDKRCPNPSGNPIHQHIVLDNGRTRAAQIYPEKLCKAICEGLQEQIRKDERGQFLLMNLDNDGTTSSAELQNSAQKIKHKYPTVEEDNDEDLEAAWDDVSGMEFDPKMVKAARQEEIEYVRKIHLYDKVPISECKRTIGRMPIIVRWVDINKGDRETPNYRSRIVAREINTYNRDDLFAATPPLEALKNILSIIATANKGEVIMVNDISLAFFHARVERDVYVQLPEEDKEVGDDNMCGKLRPSMYGTRDAAQNWYKEYSQQLIGIGFTQGKASPCTLYHPTRNIRTYVHGDDYVSSGMPKELEWMKKELEKIPGQDPSLGAGQGPIARGKDFK